MVKFFLVTRPNHDINTPYLYDFAKNIISTAKQTEDIHVIDLDGQKANSKLKKRSRTFVRTLLSNHSLI